MLSASFINTEINNYQSDIIRRVRDVCSLVLDVVLSRHKNTVIVLISNEENTRLSNFSIYLASSFCLQ